MAHQSSCEVWLGNQDVLPNMQLGWLRFYLVTIIALSGAAVVAIGHYQLMS